MPLYTQSKYCFEEPHRLDPAKPKMVVPVATADVAAISGPALPEAIIGKKPTVEELKVEIGSLRFELNKMACKLDEVVAKIGARLIDVPQRAFVAQSAPPVVSKSIKNNDSVYVGFSSDVFYTDSRPKFYSYATPIASNLHYGPREVSPSANDPPLHDVNTAVETQDRPMVKVVFENCGTGGGGANSVYEAKELCGYCYAI